MKLPSLAVMKGFHDYETISALEEGEEKGLDGGDETKQNTRHGSRQTLRKNHIQS
ncbi:PF04255 family protein [Leptospira kirschneri serovar Mozdok]|nr:PF04255 family protein [Leptospira kirschneri serovar Mozdok]NDK05248.1 hypothetical protein [Leptospira kirschneri serovar Mozdok]